MSIFSITRINRWTTSDDGESIQLELIVQDGTTITLRTPYKEVPRLAQAVVQAASMAERIQKRMPSQSLELVTPYMVAGVRAGATVDGKLAGLAFQTTERVPIQLTMTPGLARETIARLTAELEKLETTKPQKLS